MPKLKSTAPAPRKRRKRVMYLSEKLKVLDRLAAGESASAVGRYFGINESTVRSMKKNEEAIRASIASSTSISAKVVSQVRDKSIEQMEKALALWIEDQTQKKIPLSGPVIRTKAKMLFEHFKAQRSEDSKPVCDFQASKGWFEKFKMRHGFYNAKLIMESMEKDQKAEQVYLQGLHKVIEEKGYVPQQVFNADETGLFWKKLPRRTFVTKNELTAPGFKASKDRLSLLICTNASGDYIMRPMLVYRSLTPRALKNKNKNMLPVVWRANKKAWVTATLFLEWFNDYFVNEVEKYLSFKNLPFKALLILDNGPSHPVDIKFAHPNIEVVFLPMNTTSLIQPLDQGVIAAFKVYYTRHVFKHLIESLSKDLDLDVTTCWKSFNITDCMVLIQQSLKEIAPSTISSCWNKLLPESSRDESAFPSLSDDLQGISQLAHQIGGEGFEDLQAQEVAELIESHVDELSEEDLEELMNERNGFDEDEEEVSLNVGSLAEIMKLHRALVDKVVECDPVVDRRLKFKRVVEAAISPYVEIQKGLKKTQVVKSLSG